MTPRDLDHRLWRVRRRHDSIEAYLRPGQSGWSLQFARNGRVLITRSFHTRREAMTAADKRRKEFERVGWNEHW
jgi:hypothetical protein